MSVNKRAKDIISRANSTYVKTLKSEYSKLLEGGYNYITYYQINDKSSYHDNTLETYHSQTGRNSPFKYNRIYDIALYGTSPFDLQNNYGERGILTEVAGEGVILPDTIVPRAGELFTFDIEDYADHLFVITDVQGSDAGPSKYYKISYTLYQENADEIYSNVADDYIMQTDGTSGANTGTILTKTDADRADTLKTLYDNLLKEYVKDYFDEETNTFVYRSDDDEGGIYWCPYLQHFLASNDVLSYYTKTLMTELYLLDIDAFDHSDVYNERVYRKTIFKTIEQKKNIMGDKSEWVCVSDQNLRVRNLPFFFSPKNYKLLTMADWTNPYMQLTGFNLFLGDETKPYSKVKKYQQFITIDDLNDELIYTHIQVGDLLYQLDPIDKHTPIETYYVAEGGLVLPANGKDLLNATDSYTTDLLFNVIKAYVGKTLTIDDDMILQIQDYYADISVRNYIFIPIILYILKNTISTLG